MTRFFLDTEFTRHKGDLISIGIVDENGKEWYEVLDHKDPCLWVIVNVLPKLGGRSPTTFNIVQESLRQFLSPYDKLDVYADWPEDFQHFCSLFTQNGGIAIATPPLSMHLIRLANVYPENPHNALSDAKALRESFLAYEAVFKK